MLDAWRRPGAIEEPCGHVMKENGRGLGYKVVRKPRRSAAAALIAQEDGLEERESGSQYRRSQRDI